MYIKLAQTPTRILNPNRYLKGKVQNECKYPYYYANRRTIASLVWQPL